MLQTHLRQEPLKVVPAFSMPAADPLVFVEHFDAFAWPTQVDGQTCKLVLQVGRFAMLEHLLRIRLPHIDDGQTLVMTRLDLVRP